MERAVFGDPADSPFILPYLPGEAFVVNQSYCFAGGGHRNQLAYDFRMPIETDIVAIHEGIVREIREDSPDDGFGEGEHNLVFIEHPDGTSAFYAHLLQNGVDVAVGDVVSSGQRIAASGNSGLTGRPHLHLGVYRSWPPRDGEDVPLTFRNAAGPLDERGGLVMGQLYSALPE